MADAIAMKLKPCPFCEKPIPAKMSACPYCHTNDAGKLVDMDSVGPTAETQQHEIDQDMEALSSQDPYVRDQATIRLAKHGFGVTQALISILSDHKKPGLAAIAKVLGRLGDKRAIPVLAQAAKTGDESLRLACLWALSQFREPEALQTLLTEAGRAHPVTQSYLAYAIGQFQDPKAVPMLVELSKHSRRDVAFQAVSALGGYADPQGIHALQKALRRRDGLLRAAAHASLKRLGVSPLAGRAGAWGWWIAAAVLVAAAVCFFLYK